MVKIYGDSVITEQKQLAAPGAYLLEIGEHLIQQRVIRQGAYDRHVRIDTDPVSIVL